MPGRMREIEINLLYSKISKVIKFKIGKKFFKT